MANKILNLKKNDLPKSFVVTIELVTGTKIELVCASWKYFPNFVEYLTTDNEIKQFFYNNICDIMYNKEFTRIIEEINKREQSKPTEVK